MSTKSEPQSYFYHLRCPSCSSEFRVSTGSVQGMGRQVRCSVCKHIWKYRARIGDLRSKDELQSPPHNSDVPGKALQPPSVNKLNQTTGARLPSPTPDHDITTDRGADDKPVSAIVDQADPDTELPPSVSRLRNEVHAELKHVVSIVQSLRDEISSTHDETPVVAQTDSEDKQQKSIRTVLPIPALASPMSESVERPDSLNPSYPDSGSFLQDTPDSIIGQDLDNTQADQNSTLSASMPAASTDLLKKSTIPNLSPHDSSPSANTSEEDPEKGDIGDPLMEEKLRYKHEGTLTSSSHDFAGESDDANTLVDQELLAREWEEALGIPGDETEDVQNEEPVDQEKLAMEWEASLGLEADALPKTESQASSPAELAFPTQEDSTDQLETTAENDLDRLTKEMEAYLMSRSDDPITNDEPRIKGSKSKAMFLDRLPVYRKLQAQTVKEKNGSTYDSPDDDQDPTLARDESANQGEHLPGQASEQTSPDLPAAPEPVQMSFVDRFTKRRQTRKQEKAQNKKIARAQKNLKPTTSEHDDVIKAFSASPVGITRGSSTIPGDSAPAAERVGSSGTVYSKLLRQRKQEELKRDKFDAETLKEQKKNIERLRHKELARELSIASGAFRNHVTEVIRHSIGLLIFLAISGGGVYAILNKSDAIISKWPELSIVYRLFGLDYYAAGERINLSTPEVSITPGENTNSELRLWGTLRNTLPDQVQEIPNLFVLLRSGSGRILDQWEINIPQETLDPGQTIEYSDENTIKPGAEELVIGFRISSLSLEEEYIYLNNP